MKVIDNILLEWSYRCPDGIVDMNNPEKAKILFEILNEIDSKQELIDLINTSELSPEQISKLKKYVAGKVSSSDTNAALEKEFASKGLKRVAPLVIYLANNFDVEDNLLAYMQGNSQPTLSSGGNLFTLFSKSGLPEDFLKRLTQTTSNQLGAGELLLVTMLKNAKKLQARSGQGDIQIGDEIIELKGKGAALSEWGSKAPIKKAFLKAYGITDEKELSQIVKNDAWLTKIGEDLKSTENKEKAENVLRELYPNFKLNTSGLDELKKSIVEGFVDQYFKDSKVNSILVLDETTGNYKKFSKDDFKQAIGNEVQYFFTKDTAPRIYLSDEKTKVDEGAKVDFENGIPVNITISSKPISGEQLITVDGTRSTNNYDVYYSLESNPKEDNIKASQDALKYSADKISEGELRELITKTLKSRLSKVDYIGFLESKGTLNNLLLSVIKDIYGVSDENIVFVKKLDYKFIDNAVDWNQFQKESETIQKAILNFLEKTSQTPGPYKIRKSGEVQSSIVQRLHSKYDLGLNPNEPDRPLPPIFDVIVDCINSKKTLLIIDDNIHSGTDFFKIFGDINKLIDKMENESSKISEEEQNALDEIQTIIANPKFKTSSFLQDKYKELKKIEREYNERKLMISKQYSNINKNIFGYVLYRLKDSDLSK
jgi:hypothetical protein